MTTPRDHWNTVYETKPIDSVSWYQTRPDTSLAWIDASVIAPDAPLIDVGGGASVLVDYLLAEGHSQLSVLDISAAALAKARERLGSGKAALVRWIESDVRQFQAPQPYALWHDRAVFHFLTAAEDRAAYMATLRRSLLPGGIVIIATFAADGPTRCSGLEVARYDAAGLKAEFGDDFELLESKHETHITPGGAGQKFVYLRLRRT